MTLPEGRRVFVACLFPGICHGLLKHSEGSVNHAKAKGRGIESEWGAPLSPFPTIEGPNSSVSCRVALGLRKLPTASPIMAETL